MGQEYIDQFHARYPGVQAFFEQEWKRLKRFPRKDRVVPSPMGRIRRFDAYPSKALERRFRATLPQQIEADLIKNATIRLDRIFRQRDMQARIVMMIHDSLWIEAPEKEAEQAGHLTRTMMITAAKLRVPLEVEVETVRREAKVHGLR
jgi:DNA polymerase I